MDSSGDTRKAAQRAQAHDFCATSHEAALPCQEPRTRTPSPAWIPAGSSLQEQHPPHSGDVAAPPDRCSPGHKAPVHAPGACGAGGDGGAAAPTDPRQLLGQEHATAPVICVLGTNRDKLLQPL